jgi:hypothetical protein
LKASTLYRIASVLLVLFAVGHTIGFRQTDPKWGVDAVVGSMHSAHFTVQGFDRTYWDFFVAFGLFASVFLLFAAVLAWQLGGLPSATLASMRGISWALALCFVGITVLTWRYVFIVPLIFSAVITIVLISAAWVSARPRAAAKRASA